jgi:hypothetical protein
MDAFRTGRYATITALLATLGYGAAQIAQLAGLIGPPVDEIAIDAVSLAIAPAFLLAMLALRHSPAAVGRLWGDAAAMLAGAYLVFALLVYGVQLGTVIPYGSTLPGSALLAVRPHSLFWTIDGLAYVCMGGSALCAGLSLTHDVRPRRLRTMLLAHGAVTVLILWPYLYPRFSPEILLLGSPWLATATAALWLLARHFEGAGGLAPALREAPRD